MLIFDVITFWLLVARRVFDFFIDNVDFTRDLYEIFMHLIGSPAIEFYNNTIVWFFKFELSDFIVKNTPATFISCIGMVFVAIRNLLYVRIMISFFPHINPYEHPLLLITEITDIFYLPWFRLRLPRFFRMDTTVWFMYIALDVMYNYLKYLSALSDVYYHLR
jgi:hypothetical protein